MATDIYNYDEEQKKKKINLANALVKPTDFNYIAPATPTPSTGQTTLDLQKARNAADIAKKQLSRVGTDKPAIATAKAASKAATTAAKDSQKAYESELSSQGYGIKARPYEFNESRFINQNLPGQLATIEANKAATTKQIADMSIPQKEFRDTQSNLANQLLAASQGQGPSLVNTSYRKAIDNALAATLASSKSSNLSPAMAARMAVRGIGTASTTAARDTAELAAKEQLAAREQLAGVTEAGRTADITLSAQQQQQLDDMTKYYMTTGLTLQEAQNKALQDLEIAKAEQHAVAQQTMTKQPAGTSTAGTVLGAVTGGLGALFGSDKNLKEDIKSADKDVTDFMKAISAKKYKYKPEVGEDGEKVGILAQDAEKTKVGKTIVRNMRNGYKGIHSTDALSLALASLGNLNKRLSKLEGK